MTQRREGMKVKGSVRHVCVQHEIIFNAIASGDPDAAERAMTAHLDEVANYFWRAQAANEQLT